MATPPPIKDIVPPKPTKSRRQSNGNGNLTNYQRKVICEFYRKSGGVMSQKDLAQWTKHEFGLKKTPAQSTISGILRRQHEFINMSSLELGIKKRRVVQHPQLDSALANWVIQMAGRGQTVQGDLTKEKAKEFAQMLGIPDSEQPEFSNGWLHSFQLRHNFSFRKFNAEQHQAAQDDPRRSAKVLYWTNMEALMAETDKYEPKDVFAVEETPVLYTMPPVQNALEEGRMRCKKRFVVSLAANADGSEKLQPLFVSHHEHPKCFRKKTAEQHGLHYFWNNKAWMTGVIFSRWLQRLDFAMANQKRRILLFINDMPSHVVAHLDLKNVVVFVLSPAVSQMLNPITSRVVTTFKKRFRRYHLRHAIDKSETNKSSMFDVDVLQSMKWAAASWDEITTETIKRAWIPTQLVRNRVIMDDHVLLQEEEEVLLDTELEHLMLFLRLSNPVPMMEYLNDETMSDYPVHEDKFDVVSSVCEVPEDEVDESIEESPGRTLSLQEKLKAFRDVLHVLKDRTDADDTALNAIRRVQDAIRMEGQKEAMGALGSNGDGKNVFDLDTAVGADNNNASASAMTSLDVDSQQHMDASSLLDSSESSALSAASASLAEGAGDHTSSMLSGAADEDRQNVNESFHAVI
ncbi:Delta(12) fatty acid desaturase [Phytophthora nicotianae]|uniref:Delta(12) fatty acid desaturase n=1 Tax=Phytophthora nicotianae TaxID=4792 RepID=A0A0W8DUC8_PHYNI|nr:Delta(12) fatty acid desaturase [Phytophthora nicotianae]